MWDETVDVKDVSRETLDIWKTKRNPRSCCGWKMNCITEQCANNATMCHNLDRRKFQQQLMDQTKSAILTLYRLQLHCFVFAFFFLKKKRNVKDKKCYNCIWICFEIVLRNVLLKSLKDIYIKHYSISWEREKVDKRNGICFSEQLILIILSIGPILKTE